MSRLPSFFALQALEAAVRQGGYSAAARELAVTQGAVSQQIRKLEADLGARLFHRRGNDMVPTPEAASVVTLEFWPRKLTNGECGVGFCTT